MPIVRSDAARARNGYVLDEEVDPIEEKDVLDVLERVRSLLVTVLVAEWDR